ncbi:hypothetical protein NUSPORA_00879 [Nucleospora cyclopteri]
MILLAFIARAHTNSFTPSIYDPQAESILPEISQNSGFVENHNASIHGKKFGDLNIMSLNMLINNDKTAEEQIKEVVDIVDKHHPTILSLQSASDDQVKLIQASLKPHYQMEGENRYNLNMSNRKKEMTPIFYDTEVLTKIATYDVVDKSSPPHDYGIWSTFLMNNNKNVKFSVVNVDLYSADSDFIQEQLYNVIKKVETSNYKEHPIILTGMINEQSENVKNLIKKSYLNTLEADKNNAILSKTTFHSNGLLEDGRQRDFILMKDAMSRFKVNYSRILSNFNKKTFTHYPLMTIMRLNTPKTGETTK